MFDRLSLPEDLIDCRGHVLGRKGLVISPEAIEEAAASAPAEPRQVLAGTPLSQDVAEPLDEPAYAHLFQGEGVRDASAPEVEVLV